MAAWRWRQQRGGCQGGGSAAVAAVAVAATAWWRRPAWRRRRQLGRSVTLDAVAVLREAWRQRGGGNGSTAAVAAALQWRAAWQRQWQLGGSSLMAVRMRRWQRGRRQWWQQQLGRSGQLSSGSGDEMAAAALGARRRRPAWRLGQKFGGIAVSAAATERQELHCRRALPWWRQRHRR